jgi:hypothetical protein
MTDDRKKPREPDRSLINLEEDYEVRYWCKELRLEPDRLRQMVQEHGNSAEKIREALHR